MQSDPAVAAAAESGASMADDASTLLASSPPSSSSPSSSPLMRLPPAHRAARGREFASSTGAYGAAAAPSVASAAAAAAAPSARPRLSKSLLEIESNFAPLHHWLSQMESQVRDGAWPLQEEILMNCGVLQQQIQDLKAELAPLRDFVASTADDCLLTVQADVSRTTDALIGKIKTLKTSLNAMWKTNSDNTNKIQKHEDYRRSWKSKLSTCIAQFKLVKSAHRKLNSDIRDWQKSEAVQFNGLLFNVGQLINEHRALKDKCAYYGAQHDKEMAENAQHRGHIAQLEGKNKELTKKLQAQMQSGQLLELKLRGHDESIAKQYKLQMQFDKQQERLMKIESDNAELEKLLYKHEIPVPDTINKHRPRTTLPGASRVQSNRVVGDSSSYGAAAAHQPSSARSSSLSAAPARSAGITAPIDPRRNPAPMSRISGQKRPAEPLVASSNKQPTPSRGSLPTRSPSIGSTPPSPFVQNPVAYSSAPSSAHSSAPEINLFERPQPQPQHPRPRQQQPPPADPNSYWKQTAPSFQPVSDSNLYDFEYASSAQYSVRLDGQHRLEPQAAPAHSISYGD